jgi:hypothetical protein
MGNPSMEGFTCGPKVHLHEYVRRYVVNVEVGYFEGLNDGRGEGVKFRSKVIEKNHGTEGLGSIETSLSHLVKERYRLIDILLSMGNMNMSSRHLFKESEDGCKASCAKESLQLVPKCFGDGRECGGICPVVYNMRQERVVNRTGHKTEYTFV